MYLETALQKNYIADLSSYIFFFFHFLKEPMKHQTKLTLTSTTPEHIGLKNRPRVYLTNAKNSKIFKIDFLISFSKHFDTKQKTFNHYTCIVVDKTPTFINLNGVITDS